MTSVFPTSVSSVPLWLNTATPLFPSFPSVKPRGPRAISTISTSNNPKPRAISTVPLCSALFRQKFFPVARSSAVRRSPSTHVGPASFSLTAPNCSPTHPIFPHAATSVICSPGRPNALPLLGERAGVRGRFLSNPQATFHRIPAIRFNFVQVCSGLFRLKNFSEKTLCSPLALLAVLAFKQNQESGFPYSAWSAYSAVNQFSDPQSQIPNPHDARI